MPMYQVRTFIGVFTVDENRKIVSFTPFPKDPAMIASKLFGKSAVPKDIEGFVKENLLKYAIDYKFVKSEIEFNEFLTKVNSELARQKIKQSTSRDNLIIHTNNAIDELDKSINIFIERLREWYSLHFPEMDRVIENHKTYAELIEKFGNRENFDDKRLSRFKEESSGMEFNEDDASTVKLFASRITSLYSLRESLTKYLNSLLKDLAPNFTALAGDMIAARLISKAGGLERLSRMPSSTVQLLGSEKSLFRFLKSKGKSKSPKYGLIYNHPLIQNSPREKQGKIARLLAAKLSIAIKVDYFSKDYKADEMKMDLESKVKEILSSKE